MKPIHLLKLDGVPIFQQLQLEEALLRADEKNWCLINYNSPPAIVMGISGKHSELVHEERRALQQLPLIRRFSGGGTVVVDQQTCFVTFIFNTDDLDVQPFPLPIMQWTEAFYKPVFHPIPFALRENDYVIGHRKCGGNAQYLSKGRWLHHSTFLWDYDYARMECLAQPKRMPAYREERSHKDFLCKLSDEWAGETLIDFVSRIEQRLHQQHAVQSISLEAVLEVVKRPHRKATIQEIH